MGRRVTFVAMSVLLLIGGVVIGLLAHSDQRAKTVTKKVPAYDALNGFRSAGPKPAPIPSVVSGAIDPRDLELWRTVPIDAQLISAQSVTREPRQLIVTWSREHLVLTSEGIPAADWQRLGLAIWQLDDPKSATWHRVYTRESGLGSLLVGYKVSLGDVSADGRAEVLVFEDRDGSAGNGTYRLFASSGSRLRQVFSKDLSADEGTIELANRALVVRQGLDFHGVIHCCYRKMRETWLRWNGQRMVTVHQAVHDNRR